MSKYDPNTGDEALAHIDDDMVIESALPDLGSVPLSELSKVVDLANGSRLADAVASVLEDARSTDPVIAGFQSRQ